MGVDIDDQEIAMTVLTGLPSRFDNLISALDALGEDQNIFTLDFIKGRLLQEEQRTDIRIEKLNIKSESSALVATRRDGKPFTDKCTHCNKSGHPASRYCRLFPHLRPSLLATSFRVARQIFCQSSLTVALQTLLMRSLNSAPSN